MSNSKSVSHPVGLMVGSIACSAIALGILPPLFGGLALYLGYLVYRRDASLGRICLAIGGMALVVGFVLGALWGAENTRF